MYELTGTIQSTALSMDGKPLITFKVNEYWDCMKMAQELNGQPVSIKVAKKKKKRSLDSNAYFWILVDKLSQRLNIPKEDVYRNAIRNIGGVSDIVCVRNEAVEKLCSGWSKNGIGWQTDTMPSKIDGCTNVILYYGSSTYDTAQMSRLINNIVEECRLQGIETKSKEELDSLIGQWGA